MNLLLSMLPNSALFDYGALAWFIFNEIFLNNINCLKVFAFEAFIYMLFIAKQYHQSVHHTELPVILR